MTPTILRPVATPLNFTSVTVARFVPLIVIKSPGFPPSALKDVTVGAGGRTVNFALAIPPDVVTDTVWIPRPTFGTVKVAETESLAVTWALMPPTVTDETLSRFDPETVTVAPTTALVGDNANPPGASGMTVNAFVSLPPAVVTTTLVAPIATFGRVIEIDVAVLVPITALEPATVTEVAFDKF